MASLVARRALSQRLSQRLAQRIPQRTFTTTPTRLAESEQANAQGALKEETKRNPELMILGTIMVMAFGGAGLYFGSTPTVSTSENPVSMTKRPMPWESDSTEGKYRYHPNGDPGAPPKDAPSAVNVVVIPDVNLPKRLHDKYNKWGKDGY
ncbi:hypothetical protein F4778DRAFT_785829 [Xylariomycetidae sp. FL2044]|nr:hypothetical protein F4778DRAFT_785829 [Xylariomycetidae sp. FL2044]